MTFAVMAALRQSLSVGICHSLHHALLCLPPPTYAKVRSINQFDSVLGLWGGKNWYFLKQDPEGLGEHQRTG